MGLISTLYARFFFWPSPSQIMDDHRTREWVIQNRRSQQKFFKKIKKRRMWLITHISDETSCGLHFAIGYFNSDFYVSDAQSMLMAYNVKTALNDNWERVMVLLRIYTITLKSREFLPPFAVEELVNDTIWDKMWESHWDEVDLSEARQDAFNAQHARSLVKISK